MHMRRNRMHGYWSAPSCSSADTQLCSSFLVQPVQDPHLQNVRICVVPSLVPHLSLVKLHTPSFSIVFLMCNVPCIPWHAIVSQLQRIHFTFWRLCSLSQQWRANSAREVSGPLRHLPSLSCTKNHPSLCFTTHHPNYVASDIMIQSCSPYCDIVSDYLLHRTGSGGGSLGMRQLYRPLI